MTSENEHPSKKTLFAFAQGKLAADSLEQVAEHVENCATCVDFLEQSINDTLVDQLREAAIENATDMFEDSFEVNQTIQFSTTSEPVDIESILDEHPKYKLLEQIGSGGMGAVYKARHEIMDREVAIKVIRPEFVSNSEAVARFHTEVRAAAKLSHRNIVAAYDAEQVGNAHFLIMEFVVGESLAETVARRGPLPPTHACNYAVQVANGLKHAHENGMIHRDIKPQNLMKTPKGMIKILDFGLARIGNVEQEEAHLTSTGVMMGTADYIAPEQARNARDADIRSDMYSLGCTLYFLLAGQAPFKEAKNRVDKILAHCTKALPDLTQTRSDIPAEVWQIIQKLTAKDSSERFENPSELIEALTPFAKPPKRESPTAMATDGDALVEVPTMVTEAPIPQSPPSAKTPPVPFAESASSSTGVTIQTSIEHDPERVSGRAQNQKRKIHVPTVAGIGIGAISLLLLILFLPGWLNQSDNEGESEQNSSDTNQQGERKSDPKLVVAIFAYQRFCFGDFGPFRDEIQSNGYEIETAFYAKREIEHVNFTEDKTPNKHNVQVDYSLGELRQKVEDGEVAAIVIIGGDTAIDSMADGTTNFGKDFRAIYDSMKQQKRWVCAIGKGINLPYRLGLFDGLSIAEHDWLDTPKRSSVEHTRSRINILAKEKIITAKEWHDSAELGKVLLGELKNN